MRRSEPKLRPRLIAKLRAARLFELARQHGYHTDMDLARVMGVSQATVSRLRNRQRSGISDVSVGGIKSAFPDQSIDDLLDFEEIDGERDRRVERVEKTGEAEPVVA